MNPDEEDWKARDKLQGMLTVNRVCSAVDEATSRFASGIKQAQQSRIGRAGNSNRAILRGATDWQE
jgi:hypothetical protein